MYVEMMNGSGGGGGSVQIEQGSVNITGTGTNNKKTVTFQFVPDFFFFYTDTLNAAKYDKDVSTTQFVEYQSTGRTARDWGNGAQTRLSYDGNVTVEIYAYSSVGVGNYKYIAIKNQ